MKHIWKIIHWIMGHRILYRIKPVSAITPIKYGLIYNAYAVNDARNIAPSGWHVLTQTEYDTLITYMGGSSVAGQKAKEAGTDYWDAGNTGTNNYGINFRGAGERSGGLFANLKYSCKTWTSTIPFAGYNRNYELLASGNSMSLQFNLFNVGMCVRWAKDSTSLSNGDTSTMTGNDGKVYRTVCINGVEYVADNIAETKYRNGDTIPEETDNTTWAGLTTGALCAYSNDWSNVLL